MLLSNAHPCTKPKGRTSYQFRPSALFTPRTESPCVNVFRYHIIGTQFQLDSVSV